MNLVEHARRELALCGQTAEDPAYAQSIIAAIAAFASYGHSGGSAEVARNQMYDLLFRKPLSPLTSDPDEWDDVSEISGTPMWQNNRDSTAFSYDGGRTWSYIHTPEYRQHPIPSDDLLQLIERGVKSPGSVLDREPGETLSAWVARVLLKLITDYHRPQGHGEPE